MKHTLSKIKEVFALTLKSKTDVHPSVYVLLALSMGKWILIDDGCDHQKACICGQINPLFSTIKSERISQS